MTTDTKINAGTYEVLRNRLQTNAEDLRNRIQQLNADRASTFGNIDTQLLATDRVTTKNNCVPRDLVAFGQCFLFGYNVQFGLKSEINLEDVFSVCRLSDRQFHIEPLNQIIENDRFLRDFHDLYRFYKGTLFVKFFVAEPFVYMVFQVGKSASDIKALKWRCVDEHLEYVDNRSEHEVRFPSSHPFEWKRATRDHHHYGPHPHISILDRVFVETVGGDLTVKIENNTETGQGIYAEPVDNADQTLDDAEIYFVPLGNLILLKILPYQEREWRYLIYNEKIQHVMRLDEIQHACVLLPDDHGIIFPGGYYLQTGQFKRFDHGLSRMVYERTVPASNGEDFLYLFYNHKSGTYIQLRYNLIRQEVETPLICHGQSFFEDGKMVCFRSQDEPQKHHAIQIWQTPFTDAEHIPQGNKDSMLFKIGNKELVRGMAECNEIVQLIDKDDNYDGLYVDLVKLSGDVLDSYFWLSKPEAHELHDPLTNIRQTATAAVDEFEKVVRVRRETEQITVDTEQTVAELVRSIQRGRFHDISEYVAALAALREQRGHAIGLRNLRYVDLERVETLENETSQQADRLSRRCVEFLLDPNALDSYREEVSRVTEAVPSVATVAQSKALDAKIDQAGNQLELLTETVSNLQIDDTTKRTEIIDRIGDVFAALNRVRSALKARTSELVSHEGQAEFASQIRLLDQTVSGYLDVCDTPEKTDEYLTKVMVQLEDLESRFAEFDPFVEQLVEKREELYTAFESRKVQLVEKQNRQAERLAAAATRILRGIESRARSLKSSDDILAYFAADLMVEKVRGTVEQLRALDDSVRDRKSVV